MVDQIRNIIAGGERSPRDIYFQASGDLLEKVYVIHRHGVSFDIPNSDYQTIWEYDFNYPRVLNAAPIEIVSTSNEDAPGQLGAQKIFIVGCNENGDPQWEVFEPDGTTPKLTSKSFFWMDFAHVIKSGQPYGGALGDITFAHTGSMYSGDDPRVGFIKSGINRTSQAITIIPNHYSGYVLNHAVSAPFEKSIVYGFRISSWPDSEQNSVQQVAFLQGAAGGGGPYELVGRCGERIHYPALVEMVGWATTGSGLEVTGSFSMMVVHDDYDFTIPQEFFEQEDAALTAQLQARPGLAAISGSFTWTPEG